MTTLYLIQSDLVIHGDEQDAGDLLVTLIEHTNCVGGRAIPPHTADGPWVIQTFELAGAWPSQSQHPNPYDQRWRFPYADLPAGCFRLSIPITQAESMGISLRLAQVMSLLVCEHPNRIPGERWCRACWQAHLELQQAADASEAYAISIAA